MCNQSEMVLKESYMAIQWTPRVLVEQRPLNLRKSSHYRSSRGISVSISFEFEVRFRIAIPAEARAAVNSCLALMAYAHRQVQLQHIGGFEEYHSPKDIVIQHHWLIVG